VNTRPNQSIPSLDAAPAAAARRVLVVDDSRVQRKILQTSLKRWGYKVDEAGSGTEALELAKKQAYDFVLSDWVMPGVNGLELCRAMRRLENRSYSYFILLTAKDEKSEVAQGLEVGADDFLAKPVNAAELHARMIAGERILRMERELSEKNRLVSETLEEMSGLYAALDRDLLEARKLQMTLVREREHDFGTAQIAVMLRPSGHVGGDLVGYFRLGPRKLAFYGIDVSGHGVASAMLAARLAGMFSASTPEGNLTVPLRACAMADSWPPDIVAARMNRIVLETVPGDQYFTCIYAVADLVTGRVSLVQAGHPHPLVLRADGTVEAVGAGGLPVGLVPGARHERVDVNLGPGDRLLLMSDGLTEAADSGGIELGDERLLALVHKNRALRGPPFLEALLWDVQAYSGDGEMADDISGVLYEYRGPISN
jgi:sigma-B regulation protein RsbU (phosphoserine phosphatase)